MAKSYIRYHKPAYQGTQAGHTSYIHLGQSVMDMMDEVGMRGWMVVAKSYIRYHKPAYQGTQAGHTSYIHLGQSVIDI